MFLLIILKNLKANRYPSEICKGLSKLEKYKVGIKSNTVGLYKINYWQNNYKQIFGKPHTLGKTFFLSETATEVFNCEYLELVLHKRFDVYTFKMLSDPGLSIDFWKQEEGVKG